MSNWRVGSKVPLNVYEVNRPVCQCHSEEDAQRIVGAFAEVERLEKISAEAYVDLHKRKERHSEDVEKLGEGFQKFSQEWLHLDAARTALIEERDAGVATIAALRKALEPFAAWGARIRGLNYLGDDCPLIAEPEEERQAWDVTVGHLRIAGSALQSADPGFRQHSDESWARKVEALTAEVEALRQERKGQVWHWQGGGEDHLESLTCPVLISAYALRELLDKRKAAL